MKTQRFVALLLSAVIVLVALGGCSSQPTPTVAPSVPTIAPSVPTIAPSVPTVAASAPTAAPGVPALVAKRNYTIGFVLKTNNPYFSVMQKGAEAEAAKLGITLQVQAPLSLSDLEGQISIVEDMVAKHVDAIVIAPSGSKELVPAVGDAIKAGIFVVDVDNRLDADTVTAAGLKPVPYVGVVDTDSAYMVTQFLVQKLGGQGNVAIIEGIRGVDNAEHRKAGAEKAFGEAPGIKIVAEQTANWDAEQALNVVTNILTANPDLKGIFCANDQMAFGAEQAVAAAGLTGKVFIVGIDAEAQAYADIKAGTMLATVYQNQDTQGAMAVDTAVRMLNGETVPDNVVVKTILVTPADVNK